MCLAEFAAMFVTNYRSDESECDALPPTESEQSNNGKLNNRKREAIIRFHKYNKDAELV